MAGGMDGVDAGMDGVSDLEHPDRLRVRPVGKPVLDESPAWGRGPVKRLDQPSTLDLLARDVATAREAAAHAEEQEQLEAKREHCAMELLRASVGAWRMLRHPPEEVAERIAADPTGNEEKVWHMQVSCHTVPSWLLLLLLPTDLRIC